MPGEKSLVGLILVAGIAALPFWVLAYGYLPDDDALRHAAKAISGKPWAEIIVLRPDMTIDHNPGWHQLLRAVFLLTHCSARALVLFPVAGLFWLVALGPSAVLRRPEAWLLSLGLLSCLFPYLPERLFLGRPLLVTIAFTVVILQQWMTRSPSRALTVLTAALIAIATWVHGSWYLSALLPLAFLLAGERRKGLLLAICWLAGALLGACLTGQPWTFLLQSARIPLLALGADVPREILVGEFLPFAGSWPALIVAGAILASRAGRGVPLRRAWRDPALCLGVLGCLLGFRVARFWLDWGLPGLALAVARELEPVLQSFAERTTRRAATVLGAILLGFVAMGGNWNERWTRFGHFDCLKARDPETAPWLPEPGGILYSVEPSIFYHTFYCNPLGQWRYILGFEATFMRPEDFAVYANLCRTHNAVAACAPWVARMRPADRLVFTSPPNIRPAFPELEWHYAAKNTWAGRLPRTPNP